MRADYQLRNNLYGKIGSIWDRQADAATRTIANAMVDTAGSASLLMRTDVTVGHALGTSEVVVEDVSFNFVDGDFAVIGRSQRDYTHASAETPDGGIVNLALRSGEASSTAAVPTPIANLSAEFLAAIEGAEDHLSTDSDWYLIPCPAHFTPIIIESKDGQHLVSGIDFSAHPGFIATRDSPSTILPSGLVRVPVAMAKIPQPHSYVLGAPRDRRSGGFLMDYSRKSQSAKAFKLAAAEFCGLFVFRSDDVILSARPVPGAVVYVAASLGVLRIDYAHEHMLPGSTVHAGYVVAERFDILSAESFSGNIFKGAAPHSVISLDGVLPCKGLSWTANQLVLADYVEMSGSKPHVRLHLGGEPEALQAFWDAQKRHELATGVFLSDEIFSPGQTSKMVDVGTLLEGFYGNTALMVVANGLTATAATLLREFIADYKPVGCVIFTAIDSGIDVESDVPTNALLDENGLPYLDELGNYVTS